MVISILSVNNRQPSIAAAGGSPTTLFQTYFHGLEKQLKKSTVPEKIIFPGAGGPGLEHASHHHAGERCSASAMAAFAVMVPELVCAAPFSDITSG